MMAWPAGLACACAAKHNSQYARRTRCCYAATERVVGRRLDPQTGAIYHLKFKPPPPEIVGRLQQRSDDTEEKAVMRLKTHASNVDAVLGFYKGVMAEIDGNRSMPDVFKDIDKAISAAAAALA